MNTSLKGSRGEREVERILKKRFHFKHIARVKRGYGKKDFFNRFDILAVGRDSIVGVQVKRKRMTVEQAEKEVKQLAKGFERPENFFILFFWRGNREKWRFVSD